jgi:hypothetical protein
VDGVGAVLPSFKLTAGCADDGDEAAWEAAIAGNAGDEGDELKERRPLPMRWSRCTALSSPRSSGSGGDRVDAEAAAL